MSSCGFNWKATYLLPPGSHCPRCSQRLGSTQLQQTCSLPKGHEGSHRSLVNVIHGQEFADEAGIDLEDL